MKKKSRRHFGKRPKKALWGGNKKHLAQIFPPGPNHQKSPKIAKTLSLNHFWWVTKHSPKTTKPTIGVKNSWMSQRRPVCDVVEASFPRSGKKRVQCIRGRRGMKSKILRQDKTTTPWEGWDFLAGKGGALEKNLW